MYLVIPRGKIGIERESFSGSPFFRRQPLRQDRNRAGVGQPKPYLFRLSAAILRLRSMAKPPIWAHRFVEPLQSGL
jgi:hypothetical protein